MKITGARTPRSRRSAKNSRPDMSGSRTFTLQAAKDAMSQAVASSGGTYGTL
jgi:hypothetical protein